MCVGVVCVRVCLEYGYELRGDSMIEIVICMLMCIYIYQGNIIGFHQAIIRNCPWKKYRNSNNAVDNH